MKKLQINFRFHKSWVHFMKWYESHPNPPIWDIQEQKISFIFEHSTPNIINWKRLWKEFRTWYKEIYVKNKTVLWSEQQRAIETLMLGQLKELNTEQFIIVFLHKGKPEVNFEKMDYWTAVKLKDKLSGDGNGIGGDVDLEKITIVNLSHLIQ